MKLDIKHQDTDNYSQTDNNIGILFGNNVFGFDLVAELQFLNRSSLQQDQSMVLQSLP